MEQVLDVHKQPYDPLYPVVCMDESPKQLIAEKRIPLPADTITNTAGEEAATYL